MTKGTNYMQIAQRNLWPRAGFVAGGTLWKRQARARQVKPSEKSGRNFAGNLVRETFIGSKV
jgi:hypothetical protein